MAIHDVDKGNSDRNIPLPNSHDTLSGLRAAHGTNSNHPQVVGDENSQFISAGVPVFGDNITILASGTEQINRLPGAAEQSVSFPTPKGAQAFFAWGTLTNASPDYVFPLPYYAPNGTGGLLWGVRMLYSPTDGFFTIHNESYDAAVTASEYDVAVNWCLVQFPSLS